MGHNKIIKLWENGQINESNTECMMYENEFIQNDKHYSKQYQ